MLHVHMQHKSKPKVAILIGLPRENLNFHVPGWYLPYKTYMDLTNRSNSPQITTIQIMYANKHIQKSPNNNKVVITNGKPI